MISRHTLDDQVSPRGTITLGGNMSKNPLRKAKPWLCKADAEKRTGRQDTSISYARCGQLVLRIRLMGLPTMLVPHPH